jgi:hypothetical protein
MTRSFPHPSSRSPLEEFLPMAGGLLDVEERPSDRKSVGDGGGVSEDL